MRGRIVFGIVAWLLGAATATAGCLLASSLLGQGISGNSGQLLTQDAVNRALAKEAAEQSESPSAAPSGARPASVPAAPSVPPSSATDAPSPVQGTTAASAPASGDGTVLTSAGGEVVASCEAAGAYLISWSPFQGYDVSGVDRGPAATARVSFDSSANRVTMVVSCSAGVPSATSHSGESDD